MLRIVAKHSLGSLHSDVIRDVKQNNCDPKLTNFSTNLSGSDAEMGVWVHSWWCTNDEQFR